MDVNSELADAMLAEYRAFEEYYRCRNADPETRQEKSSVGATARWNDAPRGMIDKVSSYVRLDLPISQRQGRLKDCSTSSSNPMMEGPWCRVRREARARERH
jgi:hypothetical protein